MNTKIVALLIVGVLASMFSAANAGGIDICLMQSETGVCRGYFIRFAFDAAADRCVPFVYGGCGGNPNNFGTEEECMEMCG